MTGEQLLASAQVVLAEDATDAGIARGRCAAILARRSIEVVTAEVAGRHGLLAPARRVPDIHLLTAVVAIRLGLERKAAVRARWAWAELSEACHFRPNRYFPARDELTMLVTEAATWQTLLPAAGEPR